MSCGDNGDCNGNGECRSIMSILSCVCETGFEGEYCENTSGSAPGPGGAEDQLIRDLVAKLMGLVDPCCDWTVLGIIGAAFLVTVCLCFAVCYCYCCRGVSSNGRGGSPKEVDARHVRHRSPVRSRRRGDFDDDDLGIAMGPATGEFDLLFDPDYVPPPRSPRGADPHTRDGMPASPRRSHQSGARTPRQRNAPSASERRGAINKKVNNDYASIPPMQTAMVMSGAGAAQGPGHRKAAENSLYAAAGAPPMSMIAPTEYDHVPELTWDSQAMADHSASGRRKSPRSLRKSASGRRAAGGGGTAGSHDERIRAKLVPCNADAACEEILLSSRTTQLKLGRSSACDHRVHASFVSKVHCLIRATVDVSQGGGGGGGGDDDDDEAVVTFTVEDNSTNGTYLNGNRLAYHTPHVLQVGDELSLYPPNSSEVSDDEDLRYRFVTLMDTANQASVRRRQQQQQQPTASPPSNQRGVASSTAVSSRQSVSTPPPFGGVGGGVHGSQSAGRPEFGPKPAAPPPRATLNNSKRKQQKKQATLKAAAAAAADSRPSPQDDHGYQPLPVSAAEAAAMIDNAAAHSIGVRNAGTGLMTLPADAVNQATAPDEWSSIVVSHDDRPSAIAAADDGGDGEAPPEIAAAARIDRPPAAPPVPSSPSPGPSVQSLSSSSSSSPPPPPIPNDAAAAAADSVEDDGQEPTIFSPAPEIPLDDGDSAGAGKDGSAAADDGAASMVIPIMIGLDDGLAASGVVMKIEELTDDDADDDSDAKDSGEAGIVDLVSQIVNDDPAPPPAPISPPTVPDAPDFDDDDDEGPRFAVIEVRELGNKMKRVQFSRETLMEEVIDLISAWAERKSPGVTLNFRFRAFKILEDGETLRRIPDSAQLWTTIKDNEKIVVKLPKAATIKRQK